MLEGNYANTFSKVDYDFPVEGDAHKASMHHLFFQFAVHFRITAVQRPIP